MNRAKLLTIAGYNGLWWVAFWLFAYWTFPYERVAAYIADRVRESNSGYTIEIGELSPYWLTGVELDDVRVLKQAAPDAPPPGPSEPGKTVDDGAIKVREARARLGIFALLTGSRSFNFDAELERGELDGSYSEDGETKHVEATLSKIDLGKLGVLESLVSLPAKGNVEGDFDLTLGKQPKQTAGKVKLTIRGVTLGDGKAKLKIPGMMGGLTIDPVEAGNITVDVDVKDGVGTIKKLTADGKDVELEGSGEVRFNDPLVRSRLDVLLRVKFTDAYRNKSPRTKTLFSLLDGSTIPQVRSAKAPDGALQYRLTGTLAAVRAVPSGRVRAGGNL